MNIMTEILGHLTVFFGALTIVIIIALLLEINYIKQMNRMVHLISNVVKDDVKELTEIPEKHKKNESKVND